MSEIEKQYELAYHIDPVLDEAGVASMRDEIAGIVTSHGGTILFTRDPERTRLSYPIRKQRQSWFGYFHFTLESGETMPAIDEQMRLHNQVMRYLIVVRDPKLQTQPTVRMPRTAKQTIPRQADTPSDATPQEMEKQLEEVIGNL